MDDKKEDIKKRFWTTFSMAGVLTIIPVFFGLKYLNRMPEQIAIHFDAAGNPNQYMARSLAVWIVPVICLVMHILCSVCYYLCLGKVKTVEEKKMLVNLQWIIPVVSCGASFMILANALGKSINMVAFAVIIVVVVVALCVVACLPVLMRAYRKK